MYVSTHLCPCASRNADPDVLLRFHRSFPGDTSEPFFFDTDTHAGPRMWDGLNKVEIWAGYGTDEPDWEFFVDDLWIR